jgi:WD40 repeat protein
MSFFGGAAGSSSSTVVPASTEKDIEVADPPTDSISSISFSSAADYLAVGSWDNNVNLQFAIPILFGFLLTCSGIGPHLRGWSKWADTRKGDVLTPRASTKCLLEQGAS